MNALRLDRALVRELQARNNWRPALYLIFVYSGIAACFVVYGWGPKLWLTLPCLVAIAGFQHQLSIIQHEANHYLLFTNRRMNEFFGALAAYATGFTMAYRQVHLQHHRDLGGVRDPDLPNYESFPKTKKQFLLDLLRLITGFEAVIQFVRQMLGRSSAKSQGRRGLDRGLFGVALIQLLLLAGFAYFDHWSSYFLIWILPLVTLAKSFTYLRNVVEHTLVEAKGDPEASRLRTVLCGPIEQFFFAPMNFNFHAEHHLYPAIPYYNLPRAFAALNRNPAYGERVDVYCGYLRFLFTKGIR